MFLNWLFRWVLVGPIVRLFFRIKVVGMENLPREGPYILALGPHRTEFESIIVASYIRRHQLHQKHVRMSRIAIERADQRTDGAVTALQNLQESPVK